MFHVKHDAPSPKAERSAGPGVVQLVYTLRREELMSLPYTLALIHCSLSNWKLVPWTSRLPSQTTEASALWPLLQWPPRGHHPQLLSAFFGVQDGAASWR
jgi:hypothetical protein